MKVVGKTEGGRILVELDQAEHDWLQLMGSASYHVGHGEYEYNDAEKAAEEALASIKNARRLLKMAAQKLASEDDE